MVVVVGGQEDAQTIQCDAAREEGPRGCSRPIETLLDLHSPLLILDPFHHVQQPPERPLTTSAGGFLRLFDHCSTTL